MKVVSWIGPLAAGGGPSAFLPALRGSPYDLAIELPSGHFYVVSIVSVLAAALSFAIGIAGNRLRNIKITFLSLSFLSLAIVFTVHGLSTPHFLIHPSHLPSITSPLSVLVATFWLWMSSLCSNHPVIQYLAKRRKLLLPAWTAVLIAAGALLMIRPELVDFFPLTSSPLNWLVGGITILLLAVVIYRYYRAYLFSRFPLQLAIVYSATLMIVSLLVMLQGETWRISWWLYHFFLLGAMVAMVAGILLQYGSTSSLTASLRALFTNDIVERITIALPPSIKALMVATESKDMYTAGHSLRVTLYALKLAEELGLRPDQQRALAQGTLVHDVGKMAIPDSILNKPGRLTEAERKIIEQHPENGYDMCRRIGFLKDELDVIRHHHERWDGTGYPDRLEGTQIPQLARIVAVADVYDALTSRRAYRSAMTHEQAMQIIISERGKHFDPICVDAWVRMCERHPEHFPLPAKAEEGPEAFLALAAHA